MNLLFEIGFFSDLWDKGVDFIGKGLNKAAEFINSGLVIAKVVI